MSNRRIASNGNNRVRGVKRTRKKKHWFKPVFILTIMVSAVVLLLLSPVFDVSNVNVSGNSKISDAAIKQTAGLDTVVNIFSVSSSKAEKKLEQIPYIKYANISKTYPDSLSIRVVERKVCGYINYKETDTYILIDEDGMVLETKTYMEEKLPIIVGLDFESFAVGEILKTENEGTFQSVVTLWKLFEKYGLADVEKMDVSDTENIHLYIDNVDVLFYGMTDVDKKLQGLKGVIDSGKIPKGARGILDWQPPNEYIFRYLR